MILVYDFYTAIWFQITEKIIWRKSLKSSISPINWTLTDTTNSGQSGIWAMKG